MLTPAQSDEDENHNLWDPLVERSQITYVNSGTLNESVEDDLDMLDCLPIHSPATAGLVSPYMISNRIPTPRYGSFFLRPMSQRGGSDVAMGDVEDAIMQPMGLSSRNAVVENRMLPSPINEGDGWKRQILSPIQQDTDETMGRMVMESKEQDSEMEIEIPEQTGFNQAHSERSRMTHGAGRGKPMLVMGYRADCEKCRARVPGHYSHIVRA